MQTEAIIDLKPPSKIVLPPGKVEGLLYTAAIS